MPGNVLRIVPLFVAAVLAAAAGGCWGPRRFDVTGQVKYNGAPLDKPGGQVVFVGPNDTQVAASIDADGTYRAVKVPAGLNRIAVYYPNPEARDGKRLRGRPKNGEPPSSRPEAPSSFLTPARYASVNTSDLSVQVEAGTVFNIDLIGSPIP